MHITKEEQSDKDKLPVTSLIFDPRQSCTNCEESKTENGKLKEQCSALEATIEESKDNLDATLKELNDKIEDNQTKETELAKLKSEMDLLLLTNISTDCQEILKKKDEDYEILKQMVVDRDKALKKLEESYKKEVSNLTIQKIASEDALNSATEENTKLKDKEGTLVDIFKFMKKYMNEQFDIETNSIENFGCDECEESFDRIERLNAHKRTTHVKQKLSCKACNYEAESDVSLTNHLKPSLIPRLHLCVRNIASKISRKKMS